MIRLTNRSLIVLGTLALGACSATGPATREVEPKLVNRAASTTEHPSTIPAAAERRATEHGPSATIGEAPLSRNVAPAAEPSATEQRQDIAPEATSPVSSTNADDGVFAGDAEQPGRAMQILRRVEQAAAGVRTLQADFTQRLHVALLNQDQQSSGRLYQKRPDRFLMRFTSPAGDVMVADGRHFWIYYPSTDRKQVIRTSLTSGAGQVDLQRQFLGNATQRFNAVQGADESVGGRPAFVLTLTPRGASQFKRLKIWADKGDYLVRRFEITEQNESVRRIDLRNLRINAPVSDALFRFTPPAGTQVFDQ